MCVGKSLHNRVHEIHVRHFIETGKSAGLPPALITQAIDEIADAHLKINYVNNTLFLIIFLVAGARNRRWLYLNFALL